jgi:glycosyltransferase involved in cell wall biosynthesis
MKKSIQSKGLKIILVSSWPPKQCGIATFAEDLRDAILRHDSTSIVNTVAINDIGGKYKYESVVKCEIDQESLDSLDNVARYINESGADVVSLQHEFGIWGGFEGEFVGYFLKKLKIPVVTSLHTVPLVKTAKRRENRIRLIKLMAKYSKKTVVVIEKAKKQLTNEYKIPAKKIEVIPHGASDMEFVEAEIGKEKIGLSGKKVISTFGLINPNKGIDYIIEAMPKILVKHPDAIYQILGRPHPASIQAKEFYKKIEQKVKELNLEKNVLFVNKYLSTEEIIKYLQATDIYITPYLVPEQVSSGTLSYAVVAGRCVVSTHYAHANEMLKDGRGVFIEMKDSNDIAVKVNNLFDHPEEIRKKEKLAYEYGRRFTWPKVAERYLAVFSEASGK